MPGGVIQRVLTEPTFRTEYLSVDGAVPQWSERRNDAVFFESHAEADARAEAIRAALGEHVYAAVATKPIPVIAQHKPETETAGFAAVRELPAKPARKKKARRSDLEREEMRRRDEAELEEVAAFG